MLLNCNYSSALDGLKLKVKKEVEVITIDSDDDDGHVVEFQKGMLANFSQWYKLSSVSLKCFVCFEKPTSSRHLSGKRGYELLKHASYASNSDCENDDDALSKARKEAGQGLFF